MTQWERNGGEGVLYYFRERVVEEVPLVLMCIVCFAASVPAASVYIHIARE